VPQRTDLLASFAVAGNAWHLSVAPQLAPLIRFIVTAGTVSVYLRQPAPLLGRVPIAQDADGSTTIVVLLSSTAGIVALSVRYAATYVLAQPSPFRAALLDNSIHVAPADAIEASLAARLLVAPARQTPTAPGLAS
jgi:hypothetical protein